MNKHSILIHAVALLAPVVALPAAETTTQRKPNVILILTDDQGYGDLSCHGNPVLKTPELDRLCADGVELSDFHVSPLCSPTRAALMTGRHCRKVGVQSTGVNYQLAEEAVTMANVFTANGYATGIFGKWHLGERYPLRPMDRGFQESVVFRHGMISHPFDYWGNDCNDDTYFHNGVPQKYPGYCTDVWFDLAIQFIEKNKTRPFLCLLPINAPHIPLVVSEKYSKPYRGIPGVSQKDATIYGMIASVDENIGRLRKHLASLDLERDTIVIFTSDNGPVGQRFNAGMRGDKGKPYDGGHRVPCFVNYPAGNLSGGRKCGQLSAHIDILPTLAELCRLEQRPGSSDWDGVSLASVLAGGAAMGPDRILVESLREVVMTPRWRLVGKELYDIRKDPAQKENVAGQFPEVVSQLSRVLAEHAKTYDLRPQYVTIGAAQENPVELCRVDWLKPAGLSQHELAKALPYDDKTQTINVRAAKAGTYRFTLRRWPKETGVPINSALPKEHWPLYMTGPGEPLQAVEAHLRVNGKEYSCPVTEGLSGAEMSAELDAGPATLQAWFVERDQAAKAVYFIDVERKESK